MAASAFEEKEGGRVEHVQISRRVDLASKAGKRVPCDESSESQVLWPAAAHYASLLSAPFSFFFVSPADIGWDSSGVQAILTELDRVARIIGNFFGDEEVNVRLGC